MQPQNNDPQPAVAFPWSNTQILADSLRNGDLSLATAIGQLGAVMREVLKIIEDFAREQTKSNLDRKIRVEKMDKLINDLTEKCQGMQQALLYKEEKYDEKCREVERYKVICELSAKAAVSDDLYYTERDDNNNSLDFLEPEPNEELTAQDQRAESSSLSRPSIFPPVIPESKKIVKNHTKLSQGQISMSSYVQALQPGGMTRRYEHPSKSCGTSGGSASAAGEEDRSHESKMASYYVGGPCKRKQMSDEETRHRQDMKFRERVATIGGINALGPRINSGPVPLDRLYRPDNSFAEDQNKRVKIALVGQSNEVMSSSRNAVCQMKQKFTEKDLHRQVAGGSWIRMPSRRKKDWPF